MESVIASLSDISRIAAISDRSLDGSGLSAVYAAAVAALTGSSTSPSAVSLGASGSGGTSGNHVILISALNDGPHHLQVLKKLGLQMDASTKERLRFVVLGQLHLVGGSSTDAAPSAAELTGFELLGGIRTYGRRWLAAHPGADEDAADPFQHLSAIRLLKLLDFLLEDITGIAAASSITVAGGKPRTPASATIIVDDIHALLGLCGGPGDAVALLKGLAGMATFVDAGSLGMLSAAASSAVVNPASAYVKRSGFATPVTAATAAMARGSIAGGLPPSSPSPSPAQAPGTGTGSGAGAGTGTGQPSQPQPSSSRRGSMDSSSGGSGASSSSGSSSASAAIGVSSPSVAPSSSSAASSSVAVVSATPCSRGGNALRVRLLVRFCPEMDELLSFSSRISLCHYIQSSLADTLLSFAPLPSGHSKDIHGRFTLTRKPVSAVYPSWTITTTQHSSTSSTPQQQDVAAALKSVLPVVAMPRSLTEASAVAVSGSSTHNQQHHYWTSPHPLSCLYKVTDGGVRLASVGQLAVIVPSAATTAL